MSDNDKFSELDEKISNLSSSVMDVQLTQQTMSQHLRVSNISTRLDQLEKRQDEVIKLLSQLRNELAGISSGMARRDSLMLNTGLGNLRRDSFNDNGSRRNSGLITDALLDTDQMIERSWRAFKKIEALSQGKTMPVMEVEPWTPSDEVKQNIDKLFERQFQLSPWVREKRLRNTLRLILKDHLEPGPLRRSTVTKIVHDAHQTFPLWRSQIKEAMFNSWDTVQDMSFKEAAGVIFAQFSQNRLADEQESVELYAEHMIEVGQYLRRKASERAERAGRPANPQSAITNSKYWYEVRKKINEVLETKRELVRRKSSSQGENESDGDDDEDYFSPDCTQIDVASRERSQSDVQGKAEHRHSNDSGVESPV